MTSPVKTVGDTAAWLHTGERLLSENGKFEFIGKPNGDFCIHQLTDKGEKVLQIWHPPGDNWGNASSNGVKSTKFGVRDTDGKVAFFVITPAEDKRSVWASHKAGVWEGPRRLKAGLKLWNDGNLCAYEKINDINTIYWATNTQCVRRGDHLKKEGGLTDFQYLRSECDRFQLFNKGNGSVVLHQLVPHVRELWSAHAEDKLHKWKGDIDCNRLVFRSDGKIQLITPKKRYWSAENQGSHLTDKAALKLFRDGNLAAFRDDVTKRENCFWATCTGQDMSLYDNMDEYDEKLQKHEASMATLRQKLNEQNRKIVNLNTELAKERVLKRDLQSKIDELSRKVLTLAENNNKFEEFIQAVKEQAAINLELSKRIRTLEEKVDQLTETLKEKDRINESLSKLIHLAVS